MKSAGSDGSKSAVCDEVDGLLLSKWCSAVFRPHSFLIMFVWNSQGTDNLPFGCADVFVEFSHSIYVQLCC